MNDSDILECAGCGMTNYEIAKEYDISVEGVEDDSVVTNSGLWYCHRDCYRDSH